MTATPLTETELARVTRQLTYAVTADPASAYECGYIAHARELARELTTVLGGRRWEAVATEQAWTHPSVDTSSQIVVVVDDRWLVVVTRHTPADSGKDQWTIAVNGSLIRQRRFPGTIPHSIATITGHVWRHVRDMGTEPCDALACEHPPVVATWRGSFCLKHAAHR